MTTTTSMTGFKPKLFTPGDWNAFFGFGTNILTNMLTLTILLRFVIKMPDSIVFGRILPAVGLMLCLSTFYYAYLAYRLAKQTGRNDVCALPSGISVPHMFIVVFVIMLPITLTTHDPIKGWEAGLTWVFFQSFILMIGGFVPPMGRKIKRRAACLGTLAGISVSWSSEGDPQPFLPQCGWSDPRRGPEPLRTQLRWVVRGGHCLRLHELRLL